MSCLIISNRPISLSYKWCIEENPSFLYRVYENFRRVACKVQSLEVYSWLMRFAGKSRSKQCKDKFRYPGKEIVVFLDPLGIYFTSLRLKAIIF
jgi:hypothetical protein